MRIVLNVRCSFPLIICCLLLIPAKVWGQLPPNQPEQDCINALPVCQNIFDQTNSYTGEGLNPNEINNGFGASCLATAEVNDVWYIFTVQTGGDLCFSITPNNANDDYDWAVYDLTNNDCSDIFFNPLLEVSCNFSLNLGCGGVTGPNGNTNGQCADENEACIPVQAGETYVVNVSNFSSSNSGYRLDFSASTAQIFDDIPPEMDNVVQECNSNQISLSFSENVVCSTVEPTDFVLTGPGGPYTISQINGTNCDDGGTFESQFLLEVSPPLSASGTYSLSLTGEVLDNCSNVAVQEDIDFAVIVDPVGINVTSDSICLGETTTLSTTLGNDPNYTITWNPGNQSIPFLDVAPTVTTVYTVEVVNNVLGCNVFSGQVEVFVKPIPTSDFTLDAAQICALDTLTVTYTGNASPDATYNWDFDGGRIISGLREGPYQLTWDAANTPTIRLTVSENGCDGLETQSGITVNGLPEAIVDLPTSVCVGSESVFQYGGNASPQATYAWTFDDGVITSNGGLANGPGPHTIDWSTPGLKTITMEVTDNGCSNQFLTDAFEINPQPFAQIAPIEDQCQNDNLFLLRYSGGSTVVSYDWDFGDGQGSVAEAPNHRYTNSGDQVVTLIIEDNNGCLDTAAAAFFVHPEPQADFTVDPACEAAEVVFNDQSTAPAGYLLSRYQWDFGDGTAAVLQNPQKVYNQSGAYTVSLEVATDAGCVATQTQDLTIFPAPDVSFLVEEACDGQPALFTNQSTITSVSGDVIQSVTWNWGDGTSTDNQDTPTHLFPGAGTYIVGLTAISDKGCQSTGSQTVNVFNTPAIPDVRGDTVCFGEVAVLRVANLEEGSAVSWFEDSLGQTPFATGRVIITDPIVSPLTYFVDVVSAEGCSQESRTAVPLGVFPIAQGGIFASDSVIDLPNAVVTFGLDGGIQGDTYSWSFGDGGSSISDAPVHQYQFPGRYNVNVKIVDINGCAYDFSTVVEVRKFSALFVPSAFTPNSDGINDEFYVGHELLRQFTIQIYNRLGNLVFESDEMDFRWDGRDTKGKMVPEGVYIFNATGQDIDGVLFKESGTITVIK